MAERGGRPDPAAAPNTLSEADVTAYLEHHPDFLAQHPDLATLLTPPDFRRDGNVVDLQRFMLHRLKEDLSRAKGQHKDLIATGRSNLTSQQRIHAAVLAVIAATSFEQLIQIVTTDLAVLLDIDVATLCVESTVALLRPRVPGIQLLSAGDVATILPRGRFARVRERIDGDPLLFGGGAGLVRSEAVLRLAIENAPPGLLALGSRDPVKFKGGQGTELLSFLARSVAITIGQWLDL